MIVVAIYSGEWSGNFAGSPRCRHLFHSVFVFDRAACHECNRSDFDLGEQSLSCCVWLMNHTRLVVDETQQLEFECVCPNVADVAMGVMNLILFLLVVSLVTCCCACREISTFITSRFCAILLSAVFLLVPNSVSALSNGNDGCGGVGIVRHSWSS